MAGDDVSMIVRSHRLRHLAEGEIHLHKADQLSDSGHMTSESAEPADGAAGAEVWVGDQGPHVYANVVQVSPGPFDVMLIFGQQDLAKPRQPDEFPPKSETVRVSMSWAHLKSMIPIMANLVANYEQQFGQIPSPGFEQQWKAD